ncbi:SDR family oxidoreductase [Spirosoma rhododendri]|nr:SDR family oxidoreductase [Spirosoma rhododendri]
MKVWFITGTSRGFGRVWAEAALKRGDKVAATARDTDSLNDLADTYGDNFLPLSLNVDDRQACFDAIQRANDTFGRIDVLISNAGYGQFGFFEELSEDEVRKQLETNLFGSIWIIQAALPIMRAQGSGHIMQVSSIGGVTTFPIFSIYHASKWAVEGMCESLSQEVAQFGINVTLIEPGGYSTDWSGSSAKHSEPNPAYDDLRNQIKENRKKSQPGDPDATADAILQVVDAEKPPLRLFLGSVGLRLVEPKYQERLATWHEWDDVSKKAQGSQAN